MAPTMSFQFWRYHWKGGGVGCAVGWNVGEEVARHVVNATVESVANTDRASIVVLPDLAYATTASQMALSNAPSSLSCNARVTATRENPSAA